MCHLPDGSNVRPAFHPHREPCADLKPSDRTRIKQLLRCRSTLIPLFAILAAMLSGHGFAQTPSTGALVGLTLDSSGGLLQGAKVTLTDQDTGQTRNTVSDEEGRFGFFLLTPGRYELCASRADFAELCSSEVNINVTETRRLQLRLQLATVIHHVEVSGETQMVQTDNSALGRIVNETAVTGLPLVTRNFAQIATLSPGVIAG